MEQSNKTKMLTITEAQKFLGISRHSIEYKCRKGLIPGAELRDRVYLIPLQWAEIQQRKMIDMSNMLTITQAQKMLGCPRQSLQRYCNLGRIQGTVQIGNTYHIPREWVENELNGAGEFKWYRNVRSSKKDGKIPNFGRSGGKLSFRQAYEIMGVSSQTIINAIKKGQIIQDGEGISPQALEKYIELQYNPATNHNTLSTAFAAQILGVPKNAIDAAVEAGKTTSVKKKKINIDELESVLKTGDGLTTKEAAVKAKVPRSAIYLALTVGQISYNNGDGIRVEELAAFAEKSPLAGYIENPPIDIEEDVYIKDKHFLTISEAAQKVGVSYNSIYVATKAGRISKKGKYIEAEELEKYIRNLKKIRFYRPDQLDIGLLPRKLAAAIAGVDYSVINWAIGQGQLKADEKLAGIRPEDLISYLRKREMHKQGYFAEDTLTITKAAEITGISKTTLYTAIRNGQIRTEIKNGIKIPELRNYVINHRKIDIEIPPANIDLKLNGLYSMTEAAQIAGVRLSTLYNAVNSGRLRKFGKYVLRSDLDKYIVWHSSPQRFVGKRQDKEDKDENLLTTAECAQMAGVSTRAINLAVKNGRIQKQGKYIHIEEIKNYIATRRKKHLTKKENKNDNA